MIKSALCIGTIYKEELLTRFSDKNIVECVRKHGVNHNKWVRAIQTNEKTTITIKHTLNPDMQTINRKYQEKNRSTYEVYGKI